MTRTTEEDLNQRFQATKFIESKDQESSLISPTSQFANLSLGNYENKFN